MIARVVAISVFGLAACVASAAELGRMFFTPAQRNTLDVARKQNVRVEIEPSNEPPPARLPQNVSVSGVIRRSDGKNTIWVNNRAVTEQQTSDLEAKVATSDNSVLVRVPESGRSVDVKVGQTIEMLSGSIQETYIRRPPPAKPEVKTPASTENVRPDVAKVTSGDTAGAVKSVPPARRRSDSPTNADPRDDLPVNSKAEVN
jgi:hypothetical protein